MYTLANDLTAKDGVSGGVSGGLADNDGSPDDAVGALRRTHVHDQWWAVQRRGRVGVREHVVNGARGGGVGKDLAPLTQSARLVMTTDPIVLRRAPRSTCHHSTNRQPVCFTLLKCMAKGGGGLSPHQPLRSASWCTKMSPTKPHPSHRSRSPPAHPTRSRTVLPSCATRC